MQLVRLFNGAAVAKSLSIIAEMLNVYSIPRRMLYGVKNNKL